MLSFIEFILEQAKAKSEIKDKYETISLIVFDHLLKNLVYEDKDNTEKHLREMSGILRSIQCKKEIMNILEKVYLRLSSELSKQSFKTFLDYPELKQL